MPTKKSKTTPAEVNEKLLRAVGFSTINNTIVDQDTSSPVYIKGKTLKYSSTAEAVPLHKNEMMFDPINDQRQAKQIFDVFLNKEEEYNGLYTQTHYDIMQENKTAVEMRTNEGVKRSEFFDNNSLKYIDMIFKINEDEVDLTKIDKPIKKSTRRTKKKKSIFE